MVWEGIFELEQFLLYVRVWSITVEIQVMAKPSASYPCTQKRVWAQESWGISQDLHPSLGQFINKWNKSV